MKLVVLVVVMLGCHHDSISHPDIPPLPPASGTPVGYIVDAATDLKLRDDQVQQLKEIDAGLQVQLAPIDKKLAAAGKPHEESSQSSSPGPRMRGGGRGMGMGGMGGGSRMGGAGGAGGGSGTPRRHRGSGSGSGSGNDTVDKLTAERNADVHDALVRALAVLDEGQKKQAVEILSDRGVDLDPDHPSDGPNPVEDPQEP
jgi:hypothetical protein